VFANDRSAALEERCGWWGRHVLTSPMRHAKYCLARPLVGGPKVASTYLQICQWNRQSSQASTLPMLKKL
jgi:hypothetical protein